MAIFQLFGLFLSICGLTHSSVFGCIFWFMGLGQFLSFDSDLQMSHTPWNCKPTTTAWSLKSTRVRGCVIIISLPMPWVCLLCQHARSVPACQRVIPEVSELPWGPRRSQMSWRPRCATVPDGSKPTRLYLWHNFYLKWWYLHCLTSHVMAYWLWVLPFYC